MSGDLTMSDEQTALPSNDLTQGEKRRIGNPGGVEWEYLVEMVPIGFDEEEIEGLFCHWGWHGWELVQILTTDPPDVSVPTFSAFFKRRKT